MSPGRQNSFLTGGLCIATTWLPVVVLATMGYTRRWVTEDAFIDFRVVRHLLSGSGPVFNVGERVEVYTSPVWVTFLTAYGAAGAIEVGSVTMGLLLSAGALVLAQAAARILNERIVGGGAEHPGPHTLAVPLGAAVFAAVPVAWDFSTSGLESGLSVAWLGTAFWLLVRFRPMTTRIGLFVAFVIGLGVLVRPDLGLFTVGFGVALCVLVRCDARRRVGTAEWLKLVTAASALPLGYQVFRMGYFAALVPNPALAKEASAAYWSQGFRYLVDFLGPYFLWFPLLLMATWAVALLRSAHGTRDLRSAVLVLAPMASALLHALYVTRVGGDFMHGRLLLPSLFGFLVPLATLVVPASLLRGWRVAALAGVATWAVVCGLWLRVPYAGMVGPFGIADERALWAQTMEVRNPVRLFYPHHLPVVRQFKNGLEGERAIVFATMPEIVRVGPLGSSVPRSIRAVLGLTNIGRIGYLAGPDIHVVDRHGLADPIASRLLLTTRARPGHEKILPAEWILGRFGDADALSRTAVRDAAAALQCGHVARLLRATSLPMTLEVFVANMRAAWSLHHLRIPADPAAARARFCEPQHVG